MGNLANLATALGIVGKQIVNAMQATLQRNRSNASGNLSKSIKDNVVENNNTLKLQIQMEDYGEFVDGGRGGAKKGGWSNKKQDISGWLRAKGISPRQGITEKQLVFLISRKINRQGYKAKPFIQPSINSVLSKDLQGILGDAISKDIETILIKKYK